MGETKSRADDRSGRAGSSVLAGTQLLRVAWLAVAVNASFYLVLAAVTLGVVVVVPAPVILFGRLGLFLVAFPAGVLVAALRRAIRASVPVRRAPVLEGVAVAREEQPRLWGLVDDVCRVVGQRPVDELRVVLVGEASALELRGGFRRPARRVVTLPLSYLLALDDPELRVVVAHELSHFAHGDVMFSRRLVAVQAALRRTLWRLERLGSILRYPFRWYATTLYRLLASLSRRRELAADAYAAHWYGAGLVARALRVTEWLGPAWTLYWRHEVAPLLQQGLRPPIADGFGVFLCSPRVAEAVLLLKGPEGDGDIFSSHPTIVERLVALRADAPSTPNAMQAGVNPLASPARLETCLLGERSAPMRTVTWLEGFRVGLPAVWAKTLLQSPPLPKMTASGIASFIDDTLAGTETETEQGDADYLAYHLGCALASALVGAGWQLYAEPGSAIALRHAQQTIHPFDDINAISHSVLLRSEWADRCRETGIDNLSMSCTTPSSAGSVTPASTGEVVLALDPREDRGALSRGLIRTCWIVGGVSMPLLVVAAIKAPTAAAAVLMAVLDALILLGLGWLLYDQRITRRTPAQLRFDAVGLTLTHPHLLKEELHIPAEALRAVCVDRGNAGSDRRFPVFPDSEWADPRLGRDRPSTWYWEDGRPIAPSPLYGLHKQRQTYSCSSQRRSPAQESGASGYTDR